MRSEGFFYIAFTKLRRATISFFMSAHLSARTEQIGCQWTDFYEIWYLNVFKKSVEKIQSFIKIGQEWRVLCMKTNIHI